MKRTLVGMVSVAVVALAPAAASAEGEKGITIGADGAFVLPIANWSDAASVGIGALGKVAYSVAPNIDITGRIGFIYHFGKDFGGVTVRTSEIPILFGGRYTFGADNMKPYAAAEFGLTAYDVSPGTSGGAKASLTLGGGVLLGAIDIRGQIYWPSLGDFGDIIGIMVTVGYNFVAL